MHRACAFLIAFAATATAWADDGARAKLVTNDDADAVKRAACGLAGFDVSVNGARCSSMPMIEGATVVRVSTQPRDDGRVIVFVEADARDTVTSAGTTLKSKLTPPLPPRQEISVSTAPTVFSPALVTIGWASVGLGGVAVGAGLIVAIGTAVAGTLGSIHCSLSGNTSCHSDDTAEIVGLAVAGIGAAFVIVGGISVAIGNTKTSRVSAYVAPNGGGLRVTW
jgi:hypothetical protein